MNARIIKVIGAKATAQKRRPVVKLFGLWLEEMGFPYNRLVSVKHENGCLIFEALEGGNDTFLTLGKSLLNNKEGLLQVRRAKVGEKVFPTVEVKGIWLENLGFTIGSIVVVRYEYGMIRVNVLDIEKLQEVSL